MANKEFTKVKDPNREQVPNMQLPQLPGGPLNPFNIADAGGQNDFIQPKGTDGEPLIPTPASSAVYAVPFSGFEPNKPIGRGHNTAPYNALTERLGQEDLTAKLNDHLATVAEGKGLNPSALGPIGSETGIPGAPDSTDTSVNMNALALEGNPAIDQTGLQLRHGGGRNLNQTA